MIPGQRAVELAATSRGFRYDDAQHHLRYVRNLTPDSLREAMIGLSPQVCL
jgi:hypothetical protein